ncbi:6-pyruvoyl trahydropterin synthase family protein [Nocardioides marmoribigeumensis]|uniref:6-carboxy-5,6,7,8-tetrahydropterin synthase n=1 Tax=Nocardioides marmoribigeumensis TaxID=433649 RepID=A0ABU2C0I0_9ACTN|nr:6-carboxytetrahydropterin synthase [Nocardioides marmoribigeumensis]MDR7364173.1 6-pyruvoyltetrahydropterin/6-carboxytetrahydropterin synthase [Nocardioides marmoribigeumensis]
MFSLTVRDRMMVAHSLADPFFGAAQRLHGATYVVELTLWADRLDQHGVVADLGVVASGLRAVLAGLELRNLDDEPSLAGVLTTTEVLAREVADRCAARLAVGPHVTEVEAVLRESDVAWASYRRPAREA